MKTSGLKQLENGHLHSVWYVHDQSIKLSNGNVRLKSGISSRLTPREYTSETIRNEGVGKQYVRWNDDFLHQNLSFEEAAYVITLMDNVFKQMMITNGYNARNLYNDKSIGTEYYEASDYDSLIEVIENTWNEAYRIAYEYVTRTELPDSIWIEKFKPRNGQDTLFMNPLIKYFKKNDLATASAPGGSGKTKVSYAISQEVCKSINKPWKVLTVSDNIANTVQLTAEFAKFYKGQLGKRNLNIFIVGSVPTSDYRALQAWANVIPARYDQKLEEMLTKCYQSKQDCAIFVVNKSANKFLQTANKIGVDFKDFFTIMDEIQQYASESDKPKNVNSSECAIINPNFRHLFGKKLGVSATMIDRGSETSRSACFNNDVDKFGKRVVSITEIKARELGWICEKECMIIPVPTDDRFMQSLEEKRPFELTIGQNIHRVHVSQYIAIDSLRKYILPQNKSHILMLAAFVKDVETIAIALKDLQEVGLIDKDYEIIEGYAKCGTSCVNRFNRANKAIMIATRWIGVGQDTYKCDCVLPLYNPGNEWYSRQVSMRGDRIHGVNKVSLLAFVELESKLQDNIWYRACANIANGHIPNIISEAQFEESVNAINTIGSHVNPNDGANVNSNVTLIRPRNYDPILFAKWEDLTNAIATQTFIDADGNSRFSEIVFNYKRTRSTAFEDLLNEYKIQNEFDLFGLKICSLDGFIQFVKDKNEYNTYLNKWVNTKPELIRIAGARKDGAIIRELVIDNLNVTTSFEDFISTLENFLEKNNLMYLKNAFGKRTLINIWNPWCRKKIGEDAFVKRYFNNIATKTKDKNQSKRIEKLSVFINKEFLPEDVIKIFTKKEWANIRVSDLVIKLQKLGGYHNTANFYKLNEKYFN